ncbi:MAG: EamA family transporter RarD [Clostridia bacterium]|nr:EamA family transporter RarD [Clostridia bacterium]
MTELKKGTISMTASYIWWGIMPFYWSLLSTLSGAEITAYRVAFSFITIFIILLATKNLGVYSVVKDRKNLMMILFGSTMLAINWTVFMVAVSKGNLTEASMGYYIIPIVSIFLGVIFLKEKLNIWQIIALIIVSCGVVYYIISIGRVPFVSLVLAITFGLYGLYKKTMKMTSIQSFAVETSVLLPLSLIVLVVIQVNGGIAFTRQGIGTDILIILAGAVTMIPLLLFSEGAKRIPLVRVGFLQYIAPTLMLLSGLVLGGTFNVDQLITFIFIWTGLAVYTFSNLGIRRLQNDR